MIIKHPAVYSDQFLPIFYEYVKDIDCIYDPFAGNGKIAILKYLGFNGKVICNDLEPEYALLKQYPVDKWYHQDAETLIIPGVIDAIVTSPTYGNRMADSHNAKDSSKRITYTHQLGRKLTEGNTGNMQWGKNYQEKHLRCYKHFWMLLNGSGVMIINVSDHIRKGEIVNVVEFHKQAAIASGFYLHDEIKIPVKRMRFGQNNELRIDHESVLIFKKQCL